MTTQATLHDQPQTDTSEPASVTGSACKVDRRRSGWNNRCSICSHPSRAQIEMALARGASRRSVAAQYDCSDDAAYRHFENHVGDELKAALLAKYLKLSATIDAILIGEVQLATTPIITNAADQVHHSEH